MGEKPTTAFIVTLIGGIAQLILGVLLAARWGLLFGTDIDVIFGVYLIILAIITMLVAVMMHIKPSSARTWGIIVVVVSIISGLNIITIIGGTKAMKWKPSGAQPLPPPPPLPS